MSVLHLDPESWVPPYEQLRAQIAAQAAAGELPPGHRLPPVRRLAADLGVAPNTVARTYRELEQAGVVGTRGRHGTFVLPPVSDDLASAADDFARRVAALGVDPAQALDAARSAIAGRATVADGP